MLERLPSAAPRFRESPLSRPFFLGRAVNSLVGIPAGADKNAQALPAWKRMGFGFVEIGTVTLQQRSGNPAPRIWRGQNGDLFNFMGLPNDGASTVFNRIRAFRDTPEGRFFVVGVSLASPENSRDDLAAMAGLFAPVANYLAYNGSCPNVKTHAEALEEQLGNVRAIKREAGATPVFVKLAPTRDHDTLASVVKAYQAAGASGFIASNTIRPEAAVNLLSPASAEGMYWPEQGGDRIGALSGPRVFPVSLGMVREICRVVGPEVPVIGVGGVATAREAVLMMTAGAHAVQVFSAFTRQGPGIVPDLHRGIQRTLRPKL